MRTAKAPSSPVSSVMTAKIELVVATGRPINLVVDLPIPTPNTPPLMMASSDHFTWSEALFGSCKPFQ